MFLKENMKLCIICLLLMSGTLFAENNLQKGVYDSADEMMKFDEKMNQLIAEHNGVKYEKEDNSDIIDFEEREKSYVLEKEIEDNNNTQIELSVKGEMLNIEVTVREQEKVETETESSYETTLTQSIIPVYIPKNADKNSMQESYENGILKVTFYKK